jgi:glutamate---cysteine ligase / carboxylate-amine ligase
MNEESKWLHLFEAFGIELEYMIVDRSTLRVLPVTDKVLFHIAGEYASDVTIGETEWSNELALHVIELKTNGPSKTLDLLPSLFYRDAMRINSILERLGGKLMPGAMHPWMDPYSEMKLWPHDNSPIYEKYNSIFDCRGHGWANLQSMHINLPFANDEEFGRLHAAVRLALPLLPAIAAASPVADSKMSGFHDLRLEVYRNNQAKVSSITGRIIPEPVFSKADYQERIFKRMYSDISPHDPAGLLQHEWLNSRGAIARFDRNAIEIRLVDVQECPRADLAIAAFVIETLKALVNEKWIDYGKQKMFSEDDLHDILLETIKNGEHAVIGNAAFLRAFGISDGSCTGKDIWKHLYRELMTGAEMSVWQEPLTVILGEGTLATRILRSLNNDTSRESLMTVYGSLCDCLAENRMFQGISIRQPAITA